MFAGLIGLTGVSLYLMLGYLFAARFLDSWSSPRFYVLLGAPVVLFLYWVVRLVLAIRHKHRLSLIFLGIELALAATFFVFIQRHDPLANRVQSNHVALEKAALALPQGESKTPRVIGSFPVRNITRKKDTVWFECWDAMFGVEGIVYSPTPNIPERQGLKCHYKKLTGNWYCWSEDHFQ